MLTQNQFSVLEWAEADDRLSIVLIDLSGSTASRLQRSPSSKRGLADESILSFSKEYVMSLLPTLCRGNFVLIGCASRCDACLPQTPFCRCANSNHTRVLHSAEGGSDPAKVRALVQGLQPGGGTFVAGAIAALPSVALQQVELEQRRRSAAQVQTFLMALHRRVGAMSPARVLNGDTMRSILWHLGPGTVHARVIMALDGDNNVSCGVCGTCLAAGEERCELQGPQGITRAVRRLIQGSGGLKINVEMNVTMVGEAGNRTAGSSELEGLCVATGGRFDAVEERDDTFIARSFKFYDETTRKPPMHVQARVQAVSLYTQLLRTRKVPDCGVRTVFVGKDSEVWKELIRADARRTSLCEELHGAPCSHAERAHCLQSLKRTLSTGGFPRGKGTRCAWMHVGTWMK